MNTAPSLEQLEYWMGIALQEAQGAAELGEVPVGAVVLSPEFEVLAQAGNRVELQKDASAHAEMLALRAAQQKIGNWRLEDCTLVVTMEPCPMCAGHILWSRVARIVYGAGDPRLGACGGKIQILEPNPLNRELEVIRGVLEAECSEVVRQFFQMRRKQNKASKEALRQHLQSQEFLDEN
jgi:tRNA(adenine34) deaminase